LLLFLVPADAKDINAEFEILLNELRKYNPELLDKKRLLAISKADMLDENEGGMRKELLKIFPPYSFRHPAYRPLKLPIIFFYPATQDCTSAIR